MKTIKRICSHYIEFYYHSNSKNAVPNDSEIEHVQAMLTENYVEGELCMLTVINNREYIFNGWWKIV